MLSRLTFTILIVIVFLYAPLYIQGQSIDRIISSKPFDISGSISANAGIYGVDGIDARTSPFQYGISARLNMKIYGINLPIYASFRDHTFNYGSSFTRFRINPQYKWIKLHLGDTYLRFNPYTLAGRTINGYGLSLTPGRFRFKAVVGKIEDLKTYKDTLTLGTIYKPSYSRKVYAVGIGYGGGMTGIDIYGVRAFDNLDSLEGKKITYEYTRKSSTTIGGSGRIRIAKKILLSANGGLTVNTDNLDSYGENFTVGGSQGELLETNVSSYSAYGGDVGAAYGGKFFSINAKIKYIQPYYQPLTVAYINTDILNYTIGGSFNFFKSKLILVGSVGIQQNNLSSNKLSTAKHLIANLTATFRLSKSLSGSATYTNFNQDYTAKIIQIDHLYTYAITNKMMTLSLKHTAKLGQSSRLTTTLRGGTNNFLTIDDTENTITGYDNIYGTFTLGYNHIDKNFRITGNMDYRAYNRIESSSANYGVGLTLSKGFFDKKLSLNISSRYYLVDVNDQREGTTWRSSASFGYKIAKKSNIGLSLNFIDRTSAIRNDYSEYRSAINYKMSF